MSTISSVTYGNPNVQYQRRPSTGTESRAQEMRESPRQEAAEPRGEEVRETNSVSSAPQTLQAAPAASATQADWSAQPPNQTGLGYYFDTYA